MRDKNDSVFRNSLTCYLDFRRVLEKFNMPLCISNINNSHYDSNIFLLHKNYITVSLLKI